ncbi:hypothetical protein KC19_6G203500 [Ceratodon purpureus]|uniref:Uncharacterized protein n=1 Tax=Ceratodon purpureus TaxID=3225 RepID=A0A8T0HJN3_CERPU|nr:hypothetical protein KC19_6G203500 [Ceratodon purpureus]
MLHLLSRLKSVSKLPMPAYVNQIFTSGRARTHKNYFHEFWDMKGQGFVRALGPKSSTSSLATNAYLYGNVSAQNVKNANPPKPTFVTHSCSTGAVG